VPDNPYRGHRFPKEIISECVWLYFRFGVSFRDVEEMVAARGVVVSYEQSDAGAINSDASSPMA
jgi:putative transposase